MQIIVCLIFVHVFVEVSSDNNIAFYYQLFLAFYFVLLLVAIRLSRLISSFYTTNAIPILKFSVKSAGLWLLLGATYVLPSKTCQNCTLNKITLFTMGEICIYRFLKCQFYFSYIWKKQQISENIEKMMNISTIVNSVKCTVLACFFYYLYYYISQNDYDWHTVALHFL